MGKTAIAKRAAARPRGRRSSERAGWVRKNVVMDQRKLDGEPPRRWRRRTLRVRLPTDCASARTSIGHARYGRVTHGDVECEEARVSCEAVVWSRRLNKMSGGSLLKRAIARSRR